jgi:hypothetical protein
MAAFTQSLKLKGTFRLEDVKKSKFAFSPGSKNLQQEEKYAHIASN